MSALIDKEKWSESSQRSFEYSCSMQTEYENIPFLCRKCSRPSVFTAEEQKWAFEELKQSIWKRKILCDACHSDLESLQAKCRDFQNQWGENKSNLKSDYQFISSWIDALEDIPAYGRRADSSMIAMLKNLARQVD